MTVSRQREYQRRKQASGCCQTCGKARSGNRFYCEPCRIKRNARQKKAKQRRKEQRRKEQQ